LPPTFAHQLAVPLLKDFRNEHPDLTLEIASRLAANGEGDADIAIAFSQPRVTDTIHDLLWMERVTMLCSPDLLAEDGGDISGLIESADLLHVRIDERPRHYVWELFVRAIGHPDLPVDRGLVFDTAQLAVQYALSGAGIALVDPFLFPDELASGRLVQPFEVEVSDGYGYYLTTHPEQLDNEAVWLFRSWLINRFAQLGGPAGR